MEGLVPESLFEALPGHGEFFGQDSGLADCRHEIGVTGPARKNVHVDVPGYTGAGALADIHAEVEAVGMIEPAEMAFGGARQVYEFRGGLRGDAGEIGRVAVRHDHQMAAGVWEPVQHDEIVFGAMNDEGVFIMRVFGHPAKDTAFGFVSGQIGKAPRAPEIVQVVRRGDQAGISGAAPGSAFLAPALTTSFSSLLGLK